MTVGKIFGLILGIHCFFDVSDDPLNLAVEKLFIVFIEFRDADAFLLANVEFLFERLVFGHRYGGVKRRGFVVR